MRRQRKRIALLLCFCLLAGLLAGCKNDASPTDSTAQPQSTAAGTEAPVVTMPGPETTAEPVATEPPPPDYGALYLEALAGIEAETRLVIQTEIITEVSCGGNTVTEKQSEIAKYQDPGTENLILLSARTLRYGGADDVNLSQIYSDGMLYSTYRDTRFRAPETAENFLAQQTPAAMIDPSRYGSVTQHADTIVFSDAAEAEAWAMPAGGKLTEAKAAAKLKDGVLTNQTYEISYTYAGTPIHVSYSSILRTGFDTDLSASIPAKDTEFIELDSSEALLTLLRGAYSLYNVETLSCEAMSTIVCQPANVILKEQYEGHMCGSAKDLLVSEKWNTTITDLQGKESENYEETFTLIDGVSTYQMGDDEPEVTEIPSGRRTAYGQSIQTDILSNLLSNVPGFTDLTGAVVYDLGDYYLVECTCGQETAEAMEKHLNERLFQDENLLMSYAEDYSADTVEGYLALEKYTWLPTAVGYTYVATHVIDGTEARSAIEHKISLSLYDPDTCEEITGEPAPDTEPEQKPNPVFYEVTGENGEKLYLFGTIHVGDDRTGFLPQAIYDAFDSADALAVEFDTDAFEEEIENDPELMQRVAAAYYYLDGTTIADHVEDEELLENAERFMKTIGQSGDYLPLLKPFVWSNAIENFYLSQGRALTSSKGVDNRLMARAREQEKEILNVESGISQLEMLSGYSDALQELILKETLELDRCEYLDGLYELYDLWCAGDEAKLIEKINGDEEDLEEMTEEERALYDEYHTAMETSRNADMTKVAVGYLSGGKTVFFAVGLAHLLGDGGLVQSLRDAGYTVTLIQDQVP